MARRKKKNAKLVKGLKFFIIGVFILFAAYMGVRLVLKFFRTSSLFQVEEIVREPDLQFVQSSYLDRLAGRNIFSVNLSRVQKRVQQQYPQVHELRVIRRLPDRIAVTAEKREPFVLAVLTDGDAILDREGVLLGEASAFDLDTPRILGVADAGRMSVGKSLASRQVSAGMKILRAFDSDAYLSADRIRFVDVSNLSKIQVRLETGGDVYLDQYKIPHKVNVLGLLVSQAVVDLGAVEYVDLRFKEPVIRKR
ncbi:MAG: cell division protein FtsQ/DivIB [Candidatus Omnitrophota bacterium]